MQGLRGACWSLIALDGYTIRAYLLKAFRLLLDLCQLLLDVFDLPLQGRERCLFELPVALPIQQGALFQLERMALLLHAELDLASSPAPVCTAAASGPWLRHAGALPGARQAAAMGAFAEKPLDFLPEFLLALARTTLLKFQAILLSRDRLLQGCLTLLAAVYSSA